MDGLQGTYTPSVDFFEDENGTLKATYTVYLYNPGTTSVITMGDTHWQVYYPPVPLPGHAPPIAHLATVMVPDLAILPGTFPGVATGPLHLPVDPLLPSLAADAMFQDLVGGMNGSMLTLCLPTACCFVPETTWEDSDFDRELELEATVAENLEQLPLLAPYSGPALAGALLESQFGLLPNFTNCTCIPASTFPLWSEILQGTPLPVGIRNPKINFILQISIPTDAKTLVPGGSGPANIHWKNPWGAHLQVTTLFLEFEYENVLVGTIDIRNRLVAALNPYALDNQIARNIVFPAYTTADPGYTTLMAFFASVKQAATLTNAAGFMSWRMGAHSTLGVNITYSQPVNIYPTP